MRNLTSLKVLNSSRQIYNIAENPESRLASGFSISRYAAALVSTVFSLTHAIKSERR